MNFPLSPKYQYSRLFLQSGVTDFSGACHFIQTIPYGRNSNRSDLSLVLRENRGTCSTKHALLATIAVENGVSEVELVCGIFLMSASTHPQLEEVFQHYNLKHLPEAHVYLKINGKRNDFTSDACNISQIEPYIVREQRIDPVQVADWKPMIHKHFLEGWLRRNPQLDKSAYDLWNIREEMIAALSTNTLVG